MNKFLIVGAFLAGVFIYATYRNATYCQYVEGELDKAIFRFEDCKYRLENLERVNGRGN